MAALVALDAFLDKEAEELGISGKKRKREEEEEAEEELCVICQNSIELPSGELPCAHKYCFECISEWSKRSNQCPMCKKRYKKVKRVTANGRVTTKKVRKKDFDDYDNEIDSDDYVSSDGGMCMSCGAGDFPEKLFYCDYSGCDNMQHSYCCNPSVDNPPDEGDFYCGDCVATHKLPGNFTATSGDVTIPEEDEEDCSPAPLPPQPVSRAIVHPPPAPAPAPKERDSPRYSQRPSFTFNPPLIPDFTGIPLTAPPLPKNPNAKEGLLHLIKPEPDRKTREVRLHPAMKRRSVVELREGFSKVAQSQTQTQSRSSATMDSLEEPPSPERRMKEDEVVVPRRTLSATEWGRRKRAGQGTQQKAVDEDARMEELVAELGRKMRERKREPQRRRMAQIYAAKSAIIIALGAVCAGMEDVKRRTEAASTLVTIKRGVTVTAATRSAALKGIKVFLNPHYKTKTITKDQFKTCTIKTLESFLQHIYTTYPQHTPAALSSVINTKRELAYMEALCNESVKRTTGKTV